MSQQFTKASADALQHIITRLDRLEAELAIHRLKARYFHAGDIGDMGMMRACFTDDAIIDFPSYGLRCGPDELQSAFGAARQSNPGVFMHCGYGPQIEIVDDSHARGTWELLFVALTGENEQLTSVGRYTDEYRLTDTGWRISATRSDIRLSLAGTLADGVSVQDAQRS